MVQPVTVGLRIWEPDCDKLVCIVYWWFDLGFNETLRDAFCWGRLSSLSKILSLWSAKHKNLQTRLWVSLTPQYSGQTPLILEPTENHEVVEREPGKGTISLCPNTHLSLMYPMLASNSPFCRAWPYTPVLPASSPHLQGMQAWFTITPSSYILLIRDFTVNILTSVPLSCTLIM